MSRFRKPGEKMVEMTAPVPERLLKYLERLGEQQDRTPQTLMYLAVNVMLDPGRNINLLGTSAVPEEEIDGYAKVTFRVPESLAEEIKDKAENKFCMSVDEYLYKTVIYFTHQYFRHEDYFPPSGGSSIGKDYPEYLNGKREISARELKETFNFESVKTGALLTWHENQALLNMAYDQFSHLATKLNVSKSAIGLDGDLSLTLGYKGRGGRDPVFYDANDSSFNIVRVLDGDKMHEEYNKHLAHHHQKK